MSVVQQKATECAACGGPIVQAVGVDGEFCSSNCFRAGRAFCKFCGKALPSSVNKSKRVFCDSTCSSRYFNMVPVNRSRNEEISACKVCGKSITQDKNRLRVFCGKRCRDKFSTTEKYKLDLTQEWGSFAPETRKCLREIQLSMGTAAAQRLATAISREYTPRGKDLTIETRIMCCCKTCGKHFRRSLWGNRSRDYCSPKCNTLMIKQNRVENSPSAKLTWEQVDEIRHLCETGNISRREVARRYGICHSTIAQVINYKTWKPENDPRRKSQAEDEIALAKAQQAMQAAGLPPGVPGTPVLPGQVYPPPAPAPGQPAGAQQPANGGQK